METKPNPGVSKFEQRLEQARADKEAADQSYAEYKKLSGHIPQNQFDEETKIKRINQARASLELVRLGQYQELSREDLEIILDDLINRTEESELANLSLSSNGFANFEQMLRVLRLDEAKYEAPGPLAHLSSTSTRTVKSRVKLDDKGWDRFKKDPAIGRLLKGVGVSSGTTVAIAGTVTLLGGPVAWGTVAAGLIGGLAGRIGGEWKRRKMLSQEVGVLGSPDKIRLNKAVAREQFFRIATKQNEALGIKSLVDVEDKHRATLDLILKMAQGIQEQDSHTVKYREVEQRATRISRALTLVGAIGGGLASGWLAHGFAEGREATELARAEYGGDLFNTEHAELMGQVKNEGLMLDLDADEDKIKNLVRKIGEDYHFAPDQEHIVEYARANESGPLQVKELASPTLGQLFPGIDTPAIENFKDSMESRHLFPENLEPGDSAKYFHITPLDSAAVERHIKELAGGNALSDARQTADEIISKNFWAQVLSGLAVTGIVAHETIAASRENKKENLRKEDTEMLIESRREIEKHLKDVAKRYENFSGYNDQEVQKSIKDPNIGDVNWKNLEEWFTKVAERVGAKESNVPKGPAKLEKQWYRKPDLVSKNIDNLEKWKIISPSASESAEVFVAEVDLEKNLIVILYKDPNVPRNKPVMRNKKMRVTEFLEKYYFVVSAPTVKSTRNQGSESNKSATKVTTTGTPGTSTTQGTPGTKGKTPQK